jgi:Protein of unknown function (DUF2804).
MEQILLKPGKLLNEKGHLAEKGYAKSLVKEYIRGEHQVFGHFDGIAVLDNGRKLKLEHFLGFAEKVRNKW